MALGPGKYDDVLTEARTKCGATSALLIVLDGRNGRGFACQTTALDLLRLPQILRDTADAIEGDIPADLMAACWSKDK